jgi:hypothetical protein
MTVQPNTALEPTAGSAFRPAPQAGRAPRLRPAAMFGNAQAARRLPTAVIPFLLLGALPYPF